jgi:LacI family transcriptional regulator
MATLKDVAREAGVSFTTVSHVVNNTRVVAPETKERVAKAIRDLGYAPNVAARCLRMGESKTIGVVGTASADLYFGEVIRGIQRRAWNDSLGVYIAYSDLTEECPEGFCECDMETLSERETETLADFASRNIQGLILNSLRDDDELRRTLESMTTPRILFQRLVTGPGWDNFVCDDYQGATEAMRHLIGLGHRHIALIEGFGYPSHSVRFRRKAWEDCLSGIGVEPDETLARDGRYSQSAAYGLTKELLSLPHRPTAILYYSDTMALAGIRAAADLGLSVPRDLSVIGYDSLSSDEWTVPRLTSVNQKSEEIGRDMMARLIERIANPDIEPVIRTYPQTLEVRESTGPVPVPSGKNAT